MNHTQKKRVKKTSNLPPNKFKNIRARNTRAHRIFLRNYSRHNSTKPVIVHQKLYNPGRERERERERERDLCFESFKELELEEIGLWWVWFWRVCPCSRGENCIEPPWLLRVHEEWETDGFGIVFWQRNEGFWIMKVCEKQFWIDKARFMRFIYLVPPLL